jgi:hypothetical protein
MRLLIHALIVLVALGCRNVRLDSANQLGRKVTKAERDFLKESNVMRSEVVATLGLPNYESPDGRVILYWWAFAPEEIRLRFFNIADEKELTKGRNKTLLIEFNADQKVIRHELLTTITDETHEQIASRWKGK